MNDFPPVGVPTKPTPRTITRAQVQTLEALQQANLLLMEAQQKLVREAAAIVNESGPYHDFTDEFLDGYKTVSEFLERLHVVVADA